MPSSHSVSFLFSNNTINGATNVNSLGNRFDVDMSRYPIRIPAASTVCKINVTAASIPYVSPNVTAGVNNYFYFTYGIGNYTLQLPTGLYSLNNLAAEISLQCVGLGLPNNLFTFIGNTATQKVTIVYNYNGLQIDFTQANTCRLLLGFISAIIPAAPSVAGQSSTATNIATFDTLQSFLIQTNLIRFGLPINGSISTGILAVVPITIGSSPGSRIVYDPQQDQEIETTELIGTVRTVATFTLTDQEGRDVDMLGQNWSFIIKFSYDA